MRRAIVVFWVAAVVGIGLPAGAQDEGLYEPAPPPGSAFVRWINAIAPGADAPAVGTADLPSAGFGMASPYVVIPEGSYPVSQDGAETAVDLAEGRFYTIAAQGAADAPVMRLIHDDVARDRTRAQILFYNLSAADGLSLKTADGTTPVFENVPAGQAAEPRPVNAVTVAFGLFDGARALHALPPVALDAGAVYSAIAVAGEDGPALSWVRNKTAPR